MKIAQSCPTLCDPMDYTIHGILQARILEWVAVPFSRGFSRSQESNQGLLHGRQILYQLSYREAPVKGEAADTLTKDHPTMIPGGCRNLRGQQFTDLGRMVQERVEGMAGNTAGETQG